MSTYLGRKGQGYIQQIGFCQRCGWKYLRTELQEDQYIKGLLCCVYCVDPDQPQRYPVEPRPEGQPPLVPAPDQYPGPLAPTLSGAYDNADEVDLAWTASVDNADLINQYFIYRNVNSGPFALIASVPFTDSYDFPNNQVEPFTSPTVYSDDTVSPGQNYSYYVVAEAVDHRISPNSNTFSIFTQPPPAVLSGFYNFTTNAVDLSWVMPGQWGPSVQHYVLFKSVNGGAFTPLTTVSGATLSFVDTAANSFLNNYQYYVVAEFTGANSNNSNIVSAPTVVTQVFLTSGTWTKPVGAQQVAATVLGAGAGAGGAASVPGAVDATPASGCGGGGGGYAKISFVASAVAATIAITVGAAGVGGAGATTGNGGPQINGSPGTDGGSSSFGTLVVANGGTHGAGGNSSTIPGGAGGTVTHTGGSGTTETGGAGGANEASNLGNTTNNVGGSTTNAGPGGGGGGYIKNAVGGLSGISPAGGSSAAGAGGVGGTQIAVQSATATAGPGGNGASVPASTPEGGGGGGGGGAALNFTVLPNTFVATGGAGGNGGQYGAGGGGGGCAMGTDSSAAKISGPGGNGAPGIVVVTSYS